MKFFRYLLPIVVLVGCKGAPNLDGRWNMAMGPTNMQIQFGKDGRYSGTMNGLAGAGEVLGGYKIKGTVLEMDPPTIAGPNGSVTPPGGLMKVKMLPQSPDLILLDAGNQKFTLTRLGPAN